MRVARRTSVPIVAALAGVLALGWVAPASAVTPAVPPPDTTQDVVTLVGPGGRGAAFMDYTDDCAVCLMAQVQGLVPGATYRLVGSPNACGEPYVKADRLFSTTFAADGRGARWMPGRALARLDTAPLVAVRVLKGTTGTTQVACGTATHLSEELGHPAVSKLAMVARFSGSERRGLVIAVQQGEGVLRVTTALQDLPGSGSIRVRGVSGTCAVPFASATVELRGPATDVKPRHTAFSSRDIELEPGAKPGDVDSFRIGSGSGVFTPVRCADTRLLGLDEY